MRSLLSLSAKPSRRRGVRRREVFSVQFDGGQSAAMHGTSIQLSCDVLERRIVLTASESDFVFSQGTITGYKGAGGDVDIPSSINGKPVVAIGDSAFRDNTTITSVVIPRSVTTIGYFAFQGDTALTSVSIGKRVASIGGNAFAYAGLKSLEIPGSVKVIEQGAFRNNFALASVTIGRGVQTIGFEAFRSNTALSSVTISNTVKSIGGYAFQGDTALTSVTMGAGITTIGDHAFQGTALKILSLPNSLKTIGESAFQDNASLTRVTIPGSVKTIAVSAFASNAGLTDLVIGRGVKTIGDWAFASNFSLKSLVIPNSVQTIGQGAFDLAYGLERVTIGNSVTSIGDLAFYAMYNLKSVVIPNSVKTIGKSAFGCNFALETIVLGSRVTSIGASAFEQDAALKSVRFTAKAPAVGVDAFKGVPFGAKAIRAAGLSGYGPNGTFWNNLIVLTPGVAAAPTVTASTASLAQNFDTCTITGGGFLAGVPSANTVTFNLGAVGEVTAATTTTLTVKFTKQPTSTGRLTAIVANVFGTSGVPKQVATVVSADNAEVPFPELPTGAGAIDSDAPKSFAITPSGLQYRVLRQGSGAKPNATDWVSANYQGGLDGGNVTVSTYLDHPGVTFWLSAASAGFAEGMQLVGKGGMIELVIPSDLGYGFTGASSAIPPNATTHWLLELI